MIIRDNTWVPPTFPIELSHNDVHIWRLKLEQHDLSIARLASVLSEEERKRVKSFYFKKHRRRFTIGRGVLRTILGSYLNTEPDRLRFRYSPHGKPYLADESCRQTIQFSLAHSRDLVLYAFTRNHTVGVDLEYIRNSSDFKRLIDEFLSKKENVAFRTLTSSQKMGAFLGYWTRKEALGKAIGSGLDQNLDLFGSDYQLEREGNEKKDSPWSIMSFTPAKDYVAALVVEARNWNYRWFEAGFEKGQSTTTFPKEC